MFSLLVPLVALCANEKEDNAVETVTQDALPTLPCKYEEIWVWAFALPFFETHPVVFVLVGFSLRFSPSEMWS